MRLRSRSVAIGAIAATALVAVAAWPLFVSNQVAAAHAASLPTMAPVTADYLTRDKLVAYWEGAVDEHHRNDMMTPAILAGQYLQRYRERGDVGDVLRARHVAEQSLKVLKNYTPAQMQLSDALLTLHRFYPALDVLHAAEQSDPGDPGIEVQEASLDLEVGRYAAAERILASVKSPGESIALDTVRSRLLEETGHLSEARTLLERAGALQNTSFDAPAQGRAWFFFREGEMAFEAGDNDAAVADESEALTIFPQYADAGRALARFTCALHRWHECLAAATASANEVPYPETLGYEADAERALGDDAGAAQTADLIETVERIGNTQHISDRLLAVYYSEHRTHADDAYRIARNELRARDDIYTEDTLAWAAAMDGRWTEARDAARKALRFDTEDSRLQYHAAVIALHFGDRAEAKRRFARALALNPQFHAVYAGDARAWLARL